jgi:hypothetical protein
MKNFESWRASEIAKVFLQNSGRIKLISDYQNKFDYIGMYNNIKIGIEIKATKYSKSEILRVYSSLRQQLCSNEYPVIVFYVNYDKESGYFEILTKKYFGELYNMERNIFNEKILLLT